VNSESINDVGLTLGLGPSGSLSNVNIGFELGKRTINSNLVEENYAKVSVGFSFNDKWFQQENLNNIIIYQFVILDV
jgi:hypothetical protein